MLDELFMGVTEIIILVTIFLVGSFLVLFESLSNYFQSWNWLVGLYIQN